MKLVYDSLYYFIIILLMVGFAFFVIGALIVSFISTIKDRVMKSLKYNNKGSDRNGLI
jgi:hypothetical protein